MIEYLQSEFEILIRSNYIDPYLLYQNNSSFDLIFEDNKVSMEFDGTTLTGHYVDIDFGENILINRFDINITDHSAQSIKTGKILSSLTGEDGSWVEMYSFDYETAPNLEDSSTIAIELLSKKEVIGRYYRLFVTSIFRYGISPYLLSRPNAEIGLVSQSYSGTSGTSSQRSPSAAFDGVSDSSCINFYQF